MIKRQFPNESVELMAVANFIPEDRAIACLKYHIEPREISEKRFLDVAREVGYELESEGRRVDSARQAGIVLSKPRPSTLGVNRVEKAWFFSPSGTGNPAFLAFVNAKGNCSMRVFDAEDGSFLVRRYADGDYREAFREQIQGATPVSVVKQPSLEKECKQQLPSTVLAELKRQRR